MIGFFFLSLRSNAQDCERKLKSASEKYVSGHLRDIPAVLNDCIKSGFTVKQKENAYELMVLSYLFLDDEAAAEKNLIALLTDNPDYRPSPLDPPEYIHFFNNFRVDPVFSFGLSIGPNYTMLKDVQYFSGGNTKFLDAKDKSGLGFGEMLEVNVKIIKNLELNINFGFSAKRFSIEENVVTSTSNGREFITVFSKEKQFWLDIPIMLKYGVKSNRKLYAYIQGGLAYHKLVGDKLELTKEAIQEDKSKKVTEGPLISILARANHLSLRKTQHYSLVVGAGIRYKVATGLYLIGDLKYYSGLTQLANKEAAINEIPKLEYRYAYVDNYFNQNTLSISFGIAKMIYKPKRIKRGGKLILE